MKLTDEEAGQHPEARDEQTAPKSWAARLRESNERLARRAEAERGRHRPVDAVYQMVVYVITPWAIAKQGTYGALGVAAALLVGLFLISRLVVAAAVVNATLWERRARPAA